MIKAIWGTDYYGRTDQIYRRPCCGECKEPLGRSDDGRYYCYGCGKDADLDADMVEWFEQRKERKTKRIDCFACGGKKTVKAVMRRNPNTLKWQIANGKCEECGSRFIV